MAFVSSRMQAEGHDKHIHKPCVLWTVSSPEDSQVTLEQKVHRLSLLTPHLQQAQGHSAAPQPPQYRSAATMEAQWELHLRHLNLI